MPHKDQCSEAKRLGVLDHIYFMKSISTRLKAHLFRISSCVLYTPVDEHFGIVPVEAMSKGKPVIACDSGGPLETVVNGVTGVLCTADYKVFFLVKKFAFVCTYFRHLVFFASYDPIRKKSKFL